MLKIPSPYIYGTLYIWLYIRLTFFNSKTSFEEFKGKIFENELCVIIFLCIIYH